MNDKEKDKTSSEKNPFDEILFESYKYQNYKDVSGRYKFEFPDESKKEELKEIRPGPSASELLDDVININQDIIQQLDITPNVVEPIIDDFNDGDIDINEEEFDEEEDFPSEYIAVYERDGDVRISRVSSYLEIKNDHPMFSHSSVYNEYENATDIYGNNQVQDVINYPGVNLKDILINRVNHYIDFVTGEDLTSLVTKKLGCEIKDYLKNVEDLKFTSNDVQLLRTNPPLYKLLKVDKGSVKSSFTKEEIEEKYLFLLMFDPEQITEFFTTVEREPSSDMMRKYLIKLADLISAEMTEKDEIDDLEGLKEKAYEYSGYRESLGAVEVMAKEFDDYFRFCLVKDDKILITKEKVESLKILSRTLKELHIVKKCSIKINKTDKIELNKQYISEKIKDKPYLISDFSDITKLDLSHHPTMYINIFKKTDKNLYEFPENIPDELSMKMAILHEILTAESKKIKLVFNFIVVDKNNLCYVFDVKSGTIKKWKKKLYQFTDRAYWHVYNKRYDLPYEFANEGVSI